MRQREHYYVTRQYDSAGLESFLTHVAEFLSGDRTVPVTKAPSIRHESLLFTFIDDLYRLFLEDLFRIRKPYECALKYGFRGYSAGGKNGVFYLRRQDQNLAAVTNSLVTGYKRAITADLDCVEADLPDLKRVKIVYHNPSGERVVGVMNELNARAMFLGYGSY